MRGRVIVVVSSLALAFLCVCPPLASAGSAWRMKWTDGNRAGTIASVGHAPWGGIGNSDAGLGAKVRKHGYYLGIITHEMTETGPVKNLWLAFDRRGDIVAGCYIRGTSASRFVASRQSDGVAIVVAARGASGPWRIRARVGEEMEYWGTVARACPGAFAAGSWLLFWSIAP